MTVTHLEVLAGKKGTIGTWSMEKSKAKHAATEDIPDAQFYEILARYALTKEQVWSLTQFYSVDFSKSRIDVKSTFSTNAQSRFASLLLTVSWDLRA